MSRARVLFKMSRKNPEFAPEKSDRPTIDLLKKLLFFQQGSRYDYDRWSELGNSGWSYDEVLPFFLKSEDQQDPKYTHNKKYHSTGGPLPVSTPR